MAQSINRGGKLMVGDYLIRKQIGTGSFSTVWLAQHRVLGTEVAIKEIATARLSSKLRDSLKSEIVILKKINHPNIIRLHDMIEETGKIYIILEYCKGGDLFVYIQQRQGRIPEATAKHFMQQLALGLKVLRENNLIHRDLKPQNLLLSTNDDKSILKIADFGFARSLQDSRLAETLCGSPLYMAPEIMQLQKYDAKVKFFFPFSFPMQAFSLYGKHINLGMKTQADLWSVGAILYQLVTGKTPYTGNNQIQVILLHLVVPQCIAVLTSALISFYNLLSKFFYLQLLQNIIKSTELQFPQDVKDLSSDCKDLCRKLLRRNPVERLTFEEFFNHPFLCQKEPDEFIRYMRPQKIISGFPFTQSSSVGIRDEISQEELPFSLDHYYDPGSPDGSPSFVGKYPIRSTIGFSVDNPERKEVSDVTQKMDLASNSGSDVPRGGLKLSDGNQKEPLRQAKAHTKVADSFDLIDQDYVLVRGPPVDMSSSATISRLCTVLSKSGSPPQVSGSAPQVSGSIGPSPSAPVPIIGTADSRVGRTESFESHGSAPGTSQGSTDVTDVFEQPPADCMTRIRSLKRCAAAITELVNEKLEANKQLEALEIQLVILAIWKQALDICHTQAASAIEGSPTPDSTRLREMTKEQRSLDTHGSFGATEPTGSQHLCSQIERAFLLEVENAEELAKVVEPGNAEMPDAMEAIFQHALALGRRGAVSNAIF
ncbi:OLC1v1034934C1 [Oldenlandia corymbosa var. corymbosa]|uniref:OLC1v1034934C1 n=1 Tax=Oldenlandia corymbosa var. corymbosa TaxID=529605 RepID=A0AAV1CSH9_OLDCO|nr:OLC1v1034934C1 [Oldenlandia corymbosa var. corymbosa]